jgi:hypothetical protein
VIRSRVFPGSEGGANDQYRRCFLGEIPPGYDRLGEESDAFPRLALTFSQFHDFGPRSFGHARTWAWEIAVADGQSMISAEAQRAISARISLNCSIRRDREFEEMRQHRPIRGYQPNGFTARPALTPNEPLTNSSDGSWHQQVAGWKTRALA